MATFDRSPHIRCTCSSTSMASPRDRGQAMVDLIDEYRRAGFEPVANELPDYVPLFLEFLGALADDEQAQRAEQLLGEAIHVLAAIGDRLARHDSPYAAVFTVLRSLTPRAARGLHRSARARYGRSAGTVRPRRGWRGAAAGGRHAG